MSDDTLATTLILISAVFHASSNALIKSGGDKFLMRAIMLGTCGLIALPLVFFVPLPSTDIWMLLAASIGIHLVYDICLVNAYRFGDLSLVYPVMRGIAPVLTALGAYVVFVEVLSPSQTVALVVLSFGITVFAFERKTSALGSRTNWIALGFAVATGITIACYTLVDAAAMRQVMNPWTYIVWFFLFNGLVFPLGVAVWQRKTIAAAIHTDLLSGVSAGVLGIISYALALLALRLGQTAEVAALRETSVVFAAILGAVFMGEMFGQRRIIAAILIATGAIALKVV